MKINMVQNEETSNKKKQIFFKVLNDRNTAMEMTQKWNKDYGAELKTLAR